MATELSIPDWASTVPNYSVHTEPSKVGGGASAPMPWQQLVATVNFFLDSFVGQIAVAFGGIDIFGWKPLPFLADWGQARIDEASANYAAALAAQTTVSEAQATANTVNIEIALYKAALSADKVGGAALTDSFDGDASPTLDPSKWVQTPYDVGIGSCGINGTGNCTWFASGGGPRGVRNRFVTPLDSDQQAASMILDNVVPATNGTWPAIHFKLRGDTTESNYMLAQIINGAIEIGFVLNNSYTRLGTAVSVPMAGTETWMFTARTAGGVHTFTMLQNARPVLERSSPVTGPTPYGPDYRYPGFTMFAGTGLSFPFYYQIGPPDVLVFTAYDLAA